ncbi:hypothetical protein [Kluyvera genomosp. 2]|uniref:hypothetical protein n=1 Tax=Kluyvera genomosp. 2 TaxID=2774054 RepID=UPI002FD7F2EB
MKTARMLCLALAGLTFAGSAQAEKGASSGRIHFVGQIVEGGCGVTAAREGLEIACYRSGEHRVQQVALTASADTPLMRSVGTVSHRTLPGDPQLQEVVIQYL